MFRIVCLIAALALLGGPAGLALAEIYKWVDADGRLHYTTDLSQVPSSQRQQAEQGAKARGESEVIQRAPATARPVPARRAPGITRTRAGKTYTIKVPPGATSMRVMVELNDRVSAPFILDTGASDVSIPRRVADQLGIRIGPETQTMQYRTANGVIESPVIQLQSVSLGGARVENVAASISDTLPIGLLGLSFFNHFHYEIDSIQGIVHLTPNGLAESGALRGGRSEDQWRASFGNLRARIESIQLELERTPSSRSRKIAQLGEQRGALLAQLERLDAEADQARVPFTWRD